MFYCLEGSQFPAPLRHFGRLGCPLMRFLDFGELNKPIMLSACLFKDFCLKSANKISIPATWTSGSSSWVGVQLLPVGSKRHLQIYTISRIQKLRITEGNMHNDSDGYKRKSQ